MYFIILKTQNQLGTHSNFDLKFRYIDILKKKSSA